MASAAAHGYCLPMELRDLRAFVAVLELRGMTRAARRLHLVQSAVSQAVKRPDVTLRVKEGTAGELLEALRLGRLDLVAFVSPVDPEELQAVTVGELDLAFVMPPDHRLADRDVIPFCEVIDESWITFPKSNP